jgi:hypothetical protein
VFIIVHVVKFMLEDIPSFEKSLPPLTEAVCWKIHFIQATFLHAGCGMIGA